MKNAGNIMLALCASAVLLTACAESSTQSQSENTSSKTETTTTAETEATQTAESKADISSSDTDKSEKVYYIQHGPGDPADDSKKWVISDEDTVKKIDEWFENISAKLDEYALEELEDTSYHTNSTDWYAVSTDKIRNDENYFTIDFTYRQYTDEQAESIKGTNAYSNFSYKLKDYFIPEEDLSDIYTIITGEILEPAE